MASSFKNKDPRDIIGRVLMLETLRTIPPQLILELPERFHGFVSGKKTLTSIVGKDGKQLNTLSINWEYALFVATQKLLLDLFSRLTRKPKVDETSD